MNTDPKHWFWQHLCILQTRTLFASSGAPKGRRQRAAVAAPRGAKREERGPAVTPWLPLTSTRSASGSPPSPRRWRAWTVPTSRPISSRDRPACRLISSRDRPACRPMRSRHSPPLRRRWGAGLDEKDFLGYGSNRHKMCKGRISFKNWAVIVFIIVIHFKTIFGYVLLSSRWLLRV